MLRHVSRPPHSYVVAAVVAVLLYAAMFLILQWQQRRRARGSSSFLSSILWSFSSPQQQQPQRITAAANHDDEWEDIDEEEEEFVEEEEEEDEQPEDDSLPLFVLCCGVPASGKSTWCREFVERNLRHRAASGATLRKFFGVASFFESRSASAAAAAASASPSSSSSPSSPPPPFLLNDQFAVISSDDVRQQITGSINNQSQNDAVWAEVAKLVSSSLRAGVNTILDATNVDTALRRKFVSELPPCRLRIKVFSVSRSASRARLAADLRQGKERSAVPEKVLDQMHRKFAETLAALENERWRPFVCGDPELDLVVASGGGGRGGGGGSAASTPGVSPPRSPAVAAPPGCG